MLCMLCAAVTPSHTATAVAIRSLRRTGRALDASLVTCGLLGVQVGACPGALEVAGAGLLWHVHRIHLGPCPFASPHRGGLPLLSAIQLLEVHVHAAACAVAMA